MDFEVSNPGRALALVSGGLDSLLALRLMQRRGWTIEALHFETGCVRPAVSPRVGEAERVDLAAEHLRAVLDGSRRDCRRLMLERARDRADARGLHWIVTGDVQGQDRDQSREAFEAIDREVGLTGRVLRPLSEKRGQTPLGKRGLSPFPALHGQSRRGQLKLAAELGLEGIPPTKGGCCRLADPVFLRRARELVAHLERAVTRADLQLLALGRRYRLDGRSVLLVARDADEARRIAELAPPTRMRCGKRVGWILGEADAVAQSLAARLMAAPANAPELADTRI